MSQQPARPGMGLAEATAMAQRIEDRIGKPELDSLGALMRDDYRILQGMGGSGDLVRIDVCTHAQRIIHAEWLEREHAEMAEALRAIIEVVAATKSSPNHNGRPRDKVHALAWAALPPERR